VSQLILVAIFCAHVILKWKRLNSNFKIERCESRIQRLRSAFFSNKYRSALIREALRIWSKEKENKGRNVVCMCFTVER